MKSQTSRAPRALMARKAAAAIQLVVLDVDGVLTDGRLYFGPKGEALKAFHVRDGLGIQQARSAGVEIAVISGRKSAMVAVRCRELGIRHVMQGHPDKVLAFERLRARLGVACSSCACVGDDLPDVPLMHRVGLAFAVADAHSEARNAAHVVTSAPGGQGAVREVCDYLLAARSSHTGKIHASYLKDHPAPQAAARPKTRGS